MGPPRPRKFKPESDPYSIPDNLPIAPYSDEEDNNEFQSQEQRDVQEERAYRDQEDHGVKLDAEEDAAKEGEEYTQEEEDIPESEENLEYYHSIKSALINLL